MQERTLSHQNTRLFIPATYLAAAQTFSAHK